MKKWLCILLSVLLILPVSACGNGSGSAEADTGGTAENATEAESTEFFPNIGRKNYNAEYRMISVSDPSKPWYQAEELTNETLNDAVYEMNMRIKDYLGVTMKIEYVGGATGGELFGAVSPSIASGEDAYQLCIMHPYYGYNAFISSGYARDFYDFSQLDLDQPYWNRNVIDSLAINDKAYIALGDLCMYTLNILYANKNLLRDAQRDMPYDSVRAGTWTWDEFYALTKDLYRDADGNGLHDKNDVYGFAAMWDWNAASSLQAAGFYVAERNEDDEFTIAFNEDRLIDFYDSLFAWSKDESTYLWNISDELNNTNRVPFVDGHSYFTLDPLGTQFLSADFDVGILPLPKYDAAQDDYRHVNWGNNIIVPTTVQNVNMVGDVLELQAYFSKSIVQTAYYDTVLQYKVSNAPDDREMTVLVYNTVVYDPGIAFLDGNTGLGSLVYLTSYCIRDNTKKIGSFLKTNVKSAQKELDKLFRTN